MQEVEQRRSSCRGDRMARAAVYIGADATAVEQRGSEELVMHRIKFRKSRLLQLRLGSIDAPERHPDRRQTYADSSDHVFISNEGRALILHKLS